MTKPETDDASNRFGDKLSYEVISILSIVRQLLYQHIEVSISQTLNEARKQELKDK